MAEKLGSFLDTFFHHPHLTHQHVGSTCKIDLESDSHSYLDPSQHHFLSRFLDSFQEVSRLQHLPPRYILKTVARVIL